MSASPSSRRVAFVVILVALQAAALVTSAGWMIRPIRADGGTPTEHLFFDVYSLVLVLGFGSATLGCSALAGRLLGNRAERVAAIGLGAFTSLALLADVATFSFLGVHPYGRVIWSAVSSVEFKQDLPGWTWPVAAGLVALVVALSATLWGVAGRLGRWARWARVGPRLTWRLPVYFALGLATFVALDRPDEEHVVPRAALPFYGLWLARVSRFPDARPSYPLGSMPSAPHFARRPDMVLVLIESLRWDVMTPETMPVLSKLAASPGCVAGQRNYAGGHLTQYGSFPLLYGLAGYAFLPFMKEGRPSEPLAALREAGYRLEAFDATGLLYYGIVPVVPSQFDRYESPLGQDSTAIRGMIASLGEERRAPHFVFGFLFSTHGGYNYPASFARVSTSGLGTRAMLLARYHNAAGYVDALVGRLDSVLAPRLANGSAALVVTGDHGEAFGEHGFMGHAADHFYDEETRVPLVMCFARARAADVALSTNADVLPTLLDWMGAPGWDSIHLTGRSLLGPPGPRLEAIAGAGFPTQAPAFAIVTPAYKYWLHLTGPDLTAVALDKVTGPGDQPVPITADVHKAYEAVLAAFLHRERMILRVN